jgi:DNA invertase Pin-like site-specific DNA recombinase
MASRTSAPIERRIALCYVRVSSAPSIIKESAQKEKRAARRSKAKPKNKPSRIDLSEMLDSPERQRANIMAACEKRGWIPEFYEDVDGHRSGTTEKNRPKWLALKQRIGDPDVVAVVANDLSRLHRKSARMSDLLDLLGEYDMALILAAPGREVDTTTPMGQMFIMMAAMFDEFYAKDISIRAKDSHARRKDLGKAINVPFGAQRSDDGYLEPAEDGAWLMPDGQFEPGFYDDVPPDPAALWRGYYDCAQRMMELYIENKLGLERLAYFLNLEGWAFRDRHDVPRPIDKDDLRRVLRNWPEYGGLVLGGAARHRSVQEVNADSVTLLPERAIFPVELLLKVARVLRERTYEQPNHGLKRITRAYALHGMLFCAHCEARVMDNGDLSMRGKLWGKAGKDTRYRHQEGIKGCGCTNRSVTCDEVEDDVGRLLQLMCVREDVVQRMIDHAADVNPTDIKRLASLETQKKSAVERAQRRVQAAKRLFRDGDMEEAEYDAILRESDEEVQAWNRMTSEQEKVEYELRSAVEMLTKLSAVWDAGDAEQRQSLIRSLFSHFVYDLDARRIASFKLKPWVERFVDLRVQTEEIVVNPRDVRWPRRASRSYPPPQLNPLFIGFYVSSILGGCYRRNPSLTSSRQKKNGIVKSISDMSMANVP